MQSDRTPDSRDNAADRLPDQAAGRADADPADPWDAVAEFLENFLEAWEAGDSPPHLADYLPRQPLEFRRLVLSELIKVDMESRRQTGSTVMRIEDYVAAFPELLSGSGLPTDLIHEEYHLRKASGESVSADEYLSRFADHAETLAPLFQVNTDQATRVPVTGAPYSAGLPAGNHSSGGGDPADAATRKPPGLSATVGMTDSERRAEAEPDAGPPDTDKLNPGDHIDDFYLMSALGRGSFGSVFLARQESMQRLVALKISDDRGMEAATLAQLDHPHIVRVYDQHRLPASNRRLLYMQFAAGGTLQEVIRQAVAAEHRDSRVVAAAIAAAVRQTGVLAEDEVRLKPELTDRSWSETVCQIGTELAAALHYAHQQGVLHRDVKPANVLLDATGSAKLADFNISFSSEVAGDDPSRSFGGSLAYMSPEQLEACNPRHPRQPTDLDHRSDVYSLGVVLWELMFGQRPFADETLNSGGWGRILTAMAELRRRGPIALPKVADDETGWHLLMVLQRCLAADPRDRYADARELAHDLSLGLQPRVVRLLNRQRSGWRSRIMLWPLVTLVLATMVPNGLAGVFNYAYNHDAIIANLTSPAAERVFHQVQLTINAIAFPAGLAGMLLYAWPVVQALRGRRARSVQPARGQPDGFSLRRRTLRLGLFAAALGIGEWAIAGIAYPVSLQLILGGLPGEEYAHFFGSLLICGMIAAAYPFFLLSLIEIQAFLPVFMQNGPLTLADSVELHRLSQAMNWFLYLAGGVPATATLLLLLTGQMIAPHNSYALVMLSALGAIGFAFTFSLFQSLQADIAAFRESARQSALING